MTEIRYIPALTLENFTAAILKRAGVPVEQARTAASILDWANLHGVDTHGTRNLKPMYIDPIEAGKIKLDADFKVTYETPISVVADGDGGLGLVAADWAMRLAIDKAEQSGLCLVSMRNSYHFGAAGYYSMLATPKDMIGLSMSGYFFAEGSKHGVLPTFGSQPMLSTNPMSIAFPTGKEAPFLLDMATSIVPINRVLMMEEANQPVPSGWGLDLNGNPTQDPSKMRQLFPLGGTREMGSHKGFGLGLVVEVLCAILSGGWMDTSNVPNSTAFNRYKQHNDAHFFSAIRLDLFRPADEFKQDMDALINSIHAAPTSPGHESIFYPGEIEHRTRDVRVQSGIPVTEAVWSDLSSLSAQYDVPLALV